MISARAANAGIKLPAAIVSDGLNVMVSKISCARDLLVPLSVTEIGCCEELSFRNPYANNL